MTLIKIGSARVMVGPHTDGVTVTKYSGPMTHQALSELRDRAARHTAAAQGVLVDLRGVVPLNICPQAYAHDYRPASLATAAIVVSPDQRDLWCRYCLFMALRGYVRAVFVSIPEAQAWLRERLHLIPACH